MFSFSLINVESITNSYAIFIKFKYKVCFVKRHCPLFGLLFQLLTNFITNLRNNLPISTFTFSQMLMKVVTKHGVS